MKSYFHRPFYRLLVLTGPIVTATVGLHVNKLKSLSQAYVPDNIQYLLYRPLVALEGGGEKEGTLTINFHI